MAKYEITNKSSGACLGVYEAESSDDALEVMARDAGYSSYSDACAVCGDSHSDLIVSEVQS